MGPPDSPVHHRCANGRLPWFILRLKYNEYEFTVCSNTSCFTARFRLPHLHARVVLWMRPLAPETEMPQTGGDDRRRAASHTRWMTAAIATTATRRSTTACRPRASLSALLEVSDATLTSASACPRPRGNGFHRWALHAVPPDPGIGNAWRAGAGTGPPAKDRSATPWPVRACGPAVFTNGDRRVYVLSAQAWHGRTGRTPHDGMAWHGMARQQHAPVRELLPVLLGWVDRQAPGSSATLWFPAFLARFCSRHGRKGPREKTMGTVASADGVMGSEASGTLAS
jgi:hypothetical protein